MRNSILVLLGLTFLSKCAQSDCPNGIRSRKEIRDLSKNEWSAYVTALKQLNQGSNPTVYDKYSKLHVDNMQTAHGNDFFIVWHRWYIYQFELDIQKIQSSVMLPYWNTAYDSQAPESSVIFSKEYFGSTGGTCVTDGQFANWKVNVPNSHCLSRTKSAVVASFVSTDVFNNMITSTKSNHSDFRLQLEVAHNIVHSTVGGDMGTSASSNDPLFYALHGFVDKLYYMWQQQAGLTSVNGVDSKGNAITADSVLPGYPSVKVSDCFDISKLCYNYQDLMGSSISTASTAQNTSLVRRLIQRRTEPGRNYVLVDPYDRTELINLRKPLPIPEEHLRRNNIDVAAARRVEQGFYDVIGKVNAIDGYIPPSCLWMREDVLVKLISKNQNFVAIVRGTKYTADVPTTGNVMEKLKVVRETLRIKCGGYLRADPSKYISLLIGVIGEFIFSKKDACYQVTLPGVNPTVKA